MSNIVKMENTAVAAMNEAEMMNVLANSLYPGASNDSIKLVLGYCKAAGLDPMQKPVHIVPMEVKVKKADGSETKVRRDVIMPGIGLYRTQANRTGTYVGVSEPQFGPVKKIKTKVKKWNNAHQGDKTFSMVEGEDVEFPEWCRVAVKRQIGGMVAEFPAIEYWLENYATAGSDTTAPNAMWKRRPFALLAKCAEAQALRKAFPELGAAPTADETIVQDTERDMGRVEVVETVYYDQAQFDKNLAAWKELIQSGKKSVERVIAMVESKGSPFTDDQKKTLGYIKGPDSTLATSQQVADVRAAAAEATISEAEICKKFALETLDALPAEKLEPVMAFIADPMGA